MASLEGWNSAIELRPRGRRNLATRRGGGIRTPDRLPPKQVRYHCATPRSSHERVPAAHPGPAVSARNHMALALRHSPSNQPFDPFARLESMPTLPARGSLETVSRCEAMGEALRAAECYPIRDGGQTCQRNESAL